jgi:hypothetical protein
MESVNIRQVTILDGRILEANLMFNLLRWLVSKDLQISKFK